MKLLLISLALFLGGSVIAWTPGTSLVEDKVGIEGVVQPHRVVHVGAATDGLLMTVHFDRGERIEAGDVIATLDVRMAQAQADLSLARADRESAVQIAEARLADACRRLVAQETLFEKGIATPESVDTLRTEVRLQELAVTQQEEERLIAKLELARAQAALAQSTITSPLSGFVTERHLSPGEFYSQTGQAAVVTLVELDPLVVDVNVPVERFAEIEVGDKAIVRLDAAGNPVREAQVRTKARSIDTASRTFSVRLELPNPDYELPSGLRCRVIFDD